MRSRDDACNVCELRIYVGDSLACQEIGLDRHLCGESRLLPSPGMLVARMRDPAGRCPLGKWEGLAACEPRTIEAGEIERVAQRLAFKQRIKQRVTR